MQDSESESRRFSLTEAERARREVEPLLVEVMGVHRQAVELDDQLGAVASRILMMGGITVPYENLARVRFEQTRLVDQMREALERIQSIGCVVKDLDTGLVDFPAVLDDQEVYLCWRLGEDRIRFWHRQDEGFSGRKPIDPRDTGPANPIQ